MVIIQLDSEQLSTLVQNAVRKAISEAPKSTGFLESDQLLTIKQAGELISLSVPTIYGLVQRAEIPVSKRGKRLYFSKQELTDWIKAGRKLTVSEIESKASSFMVNQKRK